jgi:hypothetical protein
MLILPVQRCSTGLRLVLRASLLEGPTTSTIYLDYNPSRDPLRLDSLSSWTQRLTPPFCYDYFMLIIRLLARGLDGMRHST